MDMSTFKTILTSLNVYFSWCTCISPFNNIRLAFIFKNGNIRTGPNFMFAWDTPTNYMMMCPLVTCHKSCMTKTMVSWKDFQFQILYCTIPMYIECNVIIISNLARYSMRDWLWLTISPWRACCRDPLHGNLNIYNISMLTYYV